MENTSSNLICIDKLCYHIKPGTNYQPKRIEEGIPFLNVKNINNGYIDTTDSKLISYDDYQFVHKEWKPEQKDIIISRIGTLGLVAAIENDDLPFALHYNFINLKTASINYEVLYFVLQTKYFQNKYLSIAKQSVQSYVTIDDFKELEIPNIFEDINIKNECISLYQTIYNLRLKVKKLKQLKQSYLNKFFK